MTVEALPAPSPRLLTARLDLSGVVIALFAAVLCVLIVLPIGWLVAFAFTDRTGAVTLANFHTLVTDPAFVEPLMDDAHHRRLASASSAASSPPRWAGSSPAPTCRCARTIRILVMASFVTPPFLGAIAWELLAAPNSGLLNQLYRAVDRQRAPTSCCSTSTR